MKKCFVAVAVTLGMMMFTACGGNSDTGTTKDIVREDQADTTTDIQSQKQSYIQTENQTDIQEENETASSEDVESAADNNEPENEAETGGQTEMKMNVQVGDYTFTATLENNTAVEELVDMMKEGPITISMDDYSGFEKVGSLGRSLTTSNNQTTTDAGDIVLYNGNNIVMFYGSNSWSYTRIGKIDDLTDWNKALGSGSITAVFTIAE